MEGGLKRNYILMAHEYPYLLAIAGYRMGMGDHRGGLMVKGDHGPTK